jgi:hypothetical protein
MARLAELTKEEKAKLGKELYTNSNVDPEWMFIAEFGGYFGYAGIEALLKNEITLVRAEVLVEAQRKIWHRRMLDIAEATLASAAAAQAGKKAGSVFSALTRRFIKGMRVKQ